MESFDPENPLQQVLPGQGLGPALLRARALIDLGRHDEAKELLRVWIPRWSEVGYGLYAGSAQLELAHLCLETRDLPLARLHLQEAERLADLGDMPAVAYRPAGFGGSIAARLSLGSRWSWTGQPVRIRALGEVAIEAVGATGPSPNRRRAGATMDLLVAVLSFGGAPAPAWRVIDAVWPDADGDRGYRRLQVGLSRLRAMADADEAKAGRWIRMRDRHVVLDPDLCAVDCFAAAELLRRAQDDPEDEAACSAALASYTADFLGGGLADPRVVAYRDELRALAEAVRESVRSKKS